MTGNVSQATKGNPCTCPSGKICTPCKNKKGLRVIPHVVVEGSNHLPVPITIATYKERKPTTTTVQFIQRRKPWNVFQKPVPQKKGIRWNVLQNPDHLILDPPDRGTKLCQWYRRRRALNQLKKLAKQDLKRQETLKKQKASYERETEFIEQLMQREKEIRQEEERLEAETRKRQHIFEQKLKESYEEKTRTPDVFNPIIRREDVFAPKPRKQKVFKSKTRKQKLVKQKTKKQEVFEPKPKRQSEKKKKVKNIKATEAKPLAESRYASAKTLKPHKESFNDRFVNFCYRICCQFYCCVTILMIVGCIIIFVI